MAKFFYNNAVEKMMSDHVSGGTPPSGTLKAILMSGHTAARTDQFYSDVSTDEASGTNYTAGGQALSNVTVTQDDTGNGGAYIDFDNVVFSNITVSGVDAGIIYFDTGTPSTSRLLCYFDFDEGAQSISTGDFTLTPPAKPLQITNSA